MNSAISVLENHSYCQDQKDHIFFETFFPVFSLYVEKLIAQRQPTADTHIKHGLKIPAFDKDSNSGRRTCCSLFCGCLPGQAVFQDCCPASGSIQTWWKEPTRGKGAWMAGDDPRDGSRGVVSSALLPGPSEAGSLVYHTCCHDVWHLPRAHSNQDLKL